MIANCITEARPLFCTCMCAHVSQCESTAINHQRSMMQLSSFTSASGSSGGANLKVFCLEGSDAGGSQRLNMSSCAPLHLHCHLQKTTRSEYKVLQATCKVKQHKQKLSPQPGQVQEDALNFALWFAMPPLLTLPKCFSLSWGASLTFLSGAFGAGLGWHVAFVSQALPPLTSNRLERNTWLCEAVLF